MKNIYLTPTKIGEGRLFMDSIDNKLILKPDNTNIVFKDCEYYNVNIISDEKIKRGDWVLSFLEDESYGTSFKIEENHFYCGFDFEEDLKKIILTTDQELINDGVQAIDDEFLGWFVNNSSCFYVQVKALKSEECDCYYTKFCNSTMLDKSKHCRNGGEIKHLYKINIPKEEPTMITDWLNEHGNPEISRKVEKEAELKEAAISYAEESCNGQFPIEYAREQVVKHTKNDFIEGARWQQERMYNEEDLREAFNIARHIGRKNIAYEFDEWFNRHKKKI